VKRKFEEFELSDIIGTGTVGTIYRATEIPSGEIRAVKVLQQSVSQDKNIVSRFEREMLILAKLNHPNIVSYYGGGRTEDGRLFYVMELIDGGTLKQLLQAHNRLSWHETINYGIQICSALQHAHNHGIVHRDLKPANLFVTYQGQLKLGDFGIALDTGESDLTVSGMTVGSWLYMSPEQIRGEEIITGQADLYSLGCLLYEMLSGSPPFQGNSFPVIFEQHLKEKPAPIKFSAPETPESLQQAVLQLLAKTPQERPFNARTIQGIMSELKLDWEEDEQRYQKELSRLKVAFDADPFTVYIPNRDISWKTLTVWLVILGISVTILAVLQNQ
tara:strand:- start:3437 stop:4429 length:993 start_codon:yes stop_codon:yes gene_type:complete